MRFKSFKPAAESGGRNSIVDKLGYIPAERRIRGLLQSGVRFAAAGADMYDGFIEDGALVIPPWRSKDFDIAEGSQFLRNAVKRRDEVLRNAALAKKSDASEVDQVPEQSQTAQEGAGASVPAGGRGAAPRVPQAPPEG